MLWIPSADSEGAEMFLRRLVAGICLAVLLVLPTHPAWAWGKGHRLIRMWAVVRLPDWQRELIGKKYLDRLCRDYTSLQDKHAGGKTPELDTYCRVPDVRVSLHDVNPPAPSVAAIRWYLDRIAANIHSGDMDEAMKFLGVLCHWNEDPGCPSAHSSPISELELKTLIPPPQDKAKFNYLYGAGGIMDAGNYQLKEVNYTPRLLGRTRDEAALRIYEHQKKLRQQAATHIIPIVQDMMHGEGDVADEHRAEAALVNGRHTADVIFTAICLATDHVENQSFEWQEQPLTDWLPDFQGGMIPHPYYVSPFLVDQAMDASRKLHTLQIGDQDYPRGFGMGTPFRLNYQMVTGGVFERFTCEVGLDPTAGQLGRVIFVVEANGQELARSQPLTSQQSSLKIDVRLPNTDVLQLVLQTVAAKGSEPSHNLAVWGDPVLHAASVATDEGRIPKSN